ncbi:hypothetical protein T07_4479 [Trichinella nelsoni]|uniref:Uncharacterized protein n=1 Tax=Trichinella nelsoni TaxID=6336 RepID=A0A0V0RYU9_9BILA|nr:hypothetical protein T07_4479 [Trichinella nelsoni]
MFYLKLTPYIGVVQGDTVVVKTVGTVDSSRFVIATQEEKIIRMANFQQQHHADCFYTVWTAVHISGLWNPTAVIEKTNQILKLSMYITADDQRWLNVEQGFFIFENFQRIMQNFFHVRNLNRFVLQQFFDQVFVKLIIRHRLLGTGNFTVRSATVTLALHGTEQDLCSCT